MITFLFKCYLRDGSISYVASSVEGARGSDRIAVRRKVKEVFNARAAVDIHSFL